MTRVNLTDWEILMILDAVKLAKGSANWCCEGLRQLRLLREKFEPLAYNTRTAKAQRKRYARAVRVVKSAR